MAKRKVDDILMDTLPEPSKHAYNKAWDEFITFVGKGNPQACLCYSVLPGPFDEGAFI